MNDEYTTPDEILKKDTFFEEFRIDDGKDTKSKNNIHKILSVDKNPSELLFSNNKKSSKKSSKNLSKKSSKKLSKKSSKKNKKSEINLNKTIDIIKLLGSDFNSKRDKLKQLEENYL